MKTRFITKLERVLVSDLAEASFIQNLGVMLPATLTTEKIEIIGLASLQVDDKVENKGLFQTAKLTATLGCRIDTGVKKYAYLCTDDQGERTLIGSSSRPYAITTFSDVHPESGASRAAVTMTVNYAGWAVLHVLTQV